MIIIDGKKLAVEIKSRVAFDVTQIIHDGGQIRFDAVLVGDDASSQIYVNSKKRECEKLGISFELHYLPATVTQDDLENLITRLSSNEKINGILLQLPLPKGFDAKSAIAKIDPVKDVDGLTTINFGRLAKEENPQLIPCTALGILYAIHSVCPDVTGKNITVIGRSSIVGKPTALLLMQHNATVTICHKQTRDLAKHTRNADIVVTATGVAGLLTADMVSPKAIIIDVGINRLPDGRIVGDCDFDNVSQKVYAITPVPKGIGPLTIAFLLHNIVTAYNLQQK
ncbi:MAG: bifunctional 5,10-methylenetetrahydrofolate dehydrogenase/5,10-methenyltetrahydrofolate cyclohydrolase [Christensenellaceae bacterium]|jgi:methylenetetrahydrofolate dehydrogenase (NADP+)/methenyltetrahydrofolate cyclohydrolase|nr:bifunctional 5,10-methylenetetrahydrofolate dehydrogenase/5,10-methenyltetrahydrofolate cyclohydrolase [Christensenellaceae bacterium]